MKRRSNLFFILILIPLLSWADAKKANLIFYDQIVNPGEKVYLKASLRKGLISVKPEISGERIEFFRLTANSYQLSAKDKELKSLGIALTGTDGTAVKEIPPLKTGFHRFSARLPDTKRYSADESYGLVYCWDPKKPIIIVDIEGTVSVTDDIEIPFKKMDTDLKAVKDAPEVLRRLSKNYNIIFFTQRNELLLDKTRQWLKENKFPTAPVFISGPGEDPTTSGDYKNEKIEEWKKEGWNLKIGIGNKANDAEAYLENGMKAIILEDEEELPEKAITVKGWKEIERVILRPISKGRGKDK